METTASLTHQPYSYSKTLAEKKAWEITDSQNQWGLVTINMSLVMGPALNPKNVTSESMSFIKQMGDGTMKSGAPKKALPKWLLWLIGSMVDKTFTRKIIKNELGMTFKPLRETMEDSYQAMIDAGVLQAKE